MPSIQSNPYSSHRIATGMKHFLMGKALTSVAGIGTLLLVIRGLPVQEFAAYSILFGLVEVLLVLTSVGTGQVLTRFVPEIYARHFAHALRWLLAYALGLRFALLLVTVLALAMFTAPVASLIGLHDWQGALQLYVLVVLFRTTTNTLYQVLEAMLQQARGQGAFAVVTVSRFLGVGGLYLAGELNLLSLIIVEAASDALGALLMSQGVYQVSKRRPGDGEREPEIDWLHANARRIVSFGIKGHLQGLIIMPFSGVVNRLIIGSQLPTAQVALFGFGQSIFDLMQRYLPAQLFNGMVRPVMAARFSVNQRFDDVQVICNGALKINLLLIGLAATGFAAGGSEMLLWVSRGKYGDQAVALLLLMCALIALESWRHVLDQLSHTVERYGFLVFSNGLLGASLLGGLALLPSLGIFALPAANCAALVVANLLVIWWLRRTGYPFRQNVGEIFAILAGTGLAVGLGLWLPTVLHHWIPRVLVAVLVYAAFVWLAVGSKPEERRMIGVFVDRRRST
jgi:O-antigen/teichoic acid export membrane protein